MNHVWLAVVLVGAATVALKAAGPVLLGDRELPARVRILVGLLAPTLLTALVVTNTAASGRHIVVDARLAGVAAAAAVSLRLRAPILVAVAVAAAVTAAIRAV